MEKNKKIALIVNTVLFGLILISDALFMFTDIKTVIIKPITSAIFVLCGLFNLLYLKKYYNSKNLYKSILLFIGIIFAFIGDVVLIFDFILGAIFFAIGHIVFLVYLVLLMEVKWTDILISSIIITGCILLIYLYKGFDFKGMDLLITLYAIIISLMLGKAIGNYIIRPDTANLVMMLGAILFFISDVMLVFDNFANISGIFDYLCLSTYYPGVFLIAVSLLLQGKTLQSDNQKTKAQTKQNEN